MVRSEIPDDDVACQPKLVCCSSSLLATNDDLRQRKRDVSMLRKRRE